MANKLIYKEEFCKMLIEHMKKGYSFGTFGAIVGCGRRTLYEWVDKYPEFKEAKEDAFENAQHYFEQRLMVKTAGVDMKNIKANKIDTSCLIFALKTRFHKDYSEKVQHEHELGNKVEKLIIDMSGDKSE